MSIYTAASEMIQTALELIGVHDPGEAMTAEDGSTGLRMLNLLFDEMGIDRGKIHVLAEDTFTLVVSTGSYAIGSGQTWNTTLPVKIEQAFLRDTSVTPNYDRPLRTNMTQAEYNAIGYKSQSGIPEALFMNGKVDPATVYFDRPPNKAYAVHLFSAKPLTKLTATTDAISFPEGYDSALTYGLSIRLAPLYQVSVPEVVAVMARKMEMLVDNRNSSPPPKWHDEAQPNTMNWNRGGGRRGSRGITTI